MAKPVDPAASATLNYQWMKPAVSSSPDVWGNDLNWDLDQIDSTMWSVSSAQSGYLPLAGGTLTGSLTVGGSIASNSGNVFAKASGSGNAVFWVQNNAGVSVGNFYWIAANNQVGFNNLASTPNASVYIDATGKFNVPNLVSAGNVQAATAQVPNFYLSSNGAAQFLNWATGNYMQYANSNGATSWYSGSGIQMSLDQTGNVVVTGNVTANGLVSAVSGFMTRAGTGAANGSYLFNHFWTGAAYQLWIGAVNAGTITITSDYRAKKDVATLPSMWDAVKALRPISFTYQDYTPAIELERDADALPLIVGSDEEHWGFIAHELQETLIPSAASGVKDQVDVIQSPNPWTVIATLTKALQEAMARIEALEAR